MNWQQAPTVRNQEPNPLSPHNAAESANSWWVRRWRHQHRSGCSSSKALFTCLRTDMYASGVDRVSCNANRRRPRQRYGHTSDAWYTRRGLRVGVLLPTPGEASGGCRSEYLGTGKLPWAERPPSQLGRPKSAEVLIETTKSRSRTGDRWLDGRTKVETTASGTESLCAKGVEGSRERCSMRGPKSRLRRLGVARRQMGLVVQ